MKTSNPTASSSRLPRARLGAALSAAIVMVPGVALAQFAPPAPPAPAAAAAAQPAPAPAADPAVAPAADPAAAEPEVTTQTEAAPAPAPAASPTEELIKNTVQNMPKSFTYSGYLRSGFGINGRGGQQVSFQAPGAFAKYRLGNETDTYGELGFTNNWLNPNDDGATFATTVRLSFSSGNNNNYDNSVGFRVREAFAEAKNVIPAAPGMSLWAGNRFYDRHDIHINDFFFYDTSGLGGGFEGLKAGPGRLAVAFMGGASDDAMAQVLALGKRTKKQIDFRYRDVRLPDDSRMRLWLDFIFESPTQAGGDTVFGLAAGVMHEKSVLGGFNKAMIQYGQGSGMYFNSYLGGGEGNEDAWMLRVTELLQAQLAPRLSLMGSAIFQHIDNGTSTERWISLGVRPVYSFTQYLSLATELGIDNTQAGDADSATLGKLTIAPQITPGPNFWARPSIRAFATLAMWNDAGKGRIGGPVYSNETLGTSFGVQLESWW